MPKYTPCMDHDHTTGSLRGVLCLQCNKIEGKIKNRANTAKKSLTKEDWLENLLKYWRKHESPKSHYIYPTHKTEDEKRLLKNKRARQARAAKKAAEILRGLK